MIAPVDIVLLKIENKMLVDKVFEDPDLAGTPGYGVRTATGLGSLNSNIFEAHNFENNLLAL